MEDKDKKTPATPQETPPAQVPSDEAKQLALTQKQLDEAEAARRELSEQLKAAKAEAAESQKAHAEMANAKAKVEDDLQQLTEQIAAGTAVVKVPGSYRGYGFQDGHLRVRDKTGAIGDTAKILAAANVGDAQAQEIMDWLIKINYAYLKQVEE
jgi:hypothetical protein